MKLLEGIERKAKWFHKHEGLEATSILAANIDASKCDLFFDAKYVEKLEKMLEICRSQRDYLIATHGVFGFSQKCDKELRAIAEGK
jgi:hypothetical protein